MSAEPILVDIGLCTFRRPELADTLASLDRLVVPPGAALHIIVADNDETPAAQSLVQAFATASAHRVTYRHAPARNISIARNACLDAAGGRYLAFIDDDEVADPHWISALLDVARAEGAAAVLGPVRAVYGADAPAWMRDGDFHSTHPVHVMGRIVTGYTCNVLLDRLAPSVQGRSFDPALGRSGGEDTAYFTGLVRDGGHIAYAAQALVSEVVPAGRARFSWLARRRFRMGQTHARIVIQPGSPVRRAAETARAAAKAAWCYAMAAATLAATGTSRRHALRGTLHAGAVVGLLGMRELQQYGSMPGTTPSAGGSPDAA